VDSRTNKAIDLNYTITAPVPKQLLQDVASRFLGQHAQTIKTSLQTSLQTNFIANIFLSSSLQYVWGMINTLQLIVRLPLYALVFPPNA
jgi:hypothetical protein